MGGTIFVGIRTVDGVEHVGTTWTNWLPVFFMEPDLYKPAASDKLIGELTDCWADPNPGPYDRRLNRISHAAYGVVLLDLPVCRTPPSTRGSALTSWPA